MEVAGEAMVVKATFEKTSRRAIRRARCYDFDDHVFKISKKPLQEVDLNRSPSPNLTFLVQKPNPTTIEAILGRLEKLECSVEKQKVNITELEATIVKQKVNMTELEATVTKHEDTIMKMKVRLELMDLQNFDLYIKKMMVEKITTLTASEKNRYLKFLNKEVFGGRWQQGNCEDILTACSARKENNFSDGEVVWLEELLSKSEIKLLQMGEASRELVALSTMELRSALSCTLSVQRERRNKACHFLSMGEEAAVCLEVVDDLLRVLKSGQLNEYREVTQIMLDCTEIQS